jgi:hypothetical protein
MISVCNLFIFDVPCAADAVRKQKAFDQAMLIES